VPVHPQVAAQLHTCLRGDYVTFMRRREKGVERRLEISLFDDSPLDCGDRPRAEVLISKDPRAVAALVRMRSLSARIQGL